MRGAIIDGLVERFTSRVSHPAPLALFAARLVLAVLLLALTASSHAAAPSALDGFDPNINNDVTDIVVQPDGKILLAGSFTQIGGVACKHLARLNPDGSLDATFNPGVSDDSSFVAIALQSDGKVLVGGYFKRLDGSTLGFMARLGADGSIDTTFNPGDGPNRYVSTLAVQPDGKVIVGGDFTTINGTARNRIARLNYDGSLDTTFNPGTGPDVPVQAIVLQPDGKVLLAGHFSQVNGTACKFIARLNADGSLDTPFKINSTFLGYGFDALALQPDGRIVVGGDFIYHDGTLRNYLARLNSDGSLDSTFNPGAGPPTRVYSLALQPDGKVLLGSTNHIDRLNVNGSVDASFVPPPIRQFNTTLDDPSWIYALAVQPDGKILLGGFIHSFNYNGVKRDHFARLNSDGSLETNFTPGTGASGVVNAVATQPDGKILLGGSIIRFNGTACHSIARIDHDGSLDTTFNSGTGASGPLFGVAVQPDGKVVLAGDFTMFNGAARNGIVRLNADGSLDATFFAGAGANAPVWALALQPDGKILLAGEFTSIHGVTRSHIARLNADGSLDTSFNTAVGTNDIVMTLALHSDGKIILGGDFTRVNATTRIRVARLNADGSLDSTFDPGSGPNLRVNAMALQDDGKVLLAGQFTSVSGAARNRIARLNADGSLDTSFDPGSGADDVIYGLALQADGKVLLGGIFFSINGAGRHQNARLNADGSVDTTFISDGGPSPWDTVSGLALQSDGKVLLGGYFSMLAGTARNNIDRFSNPDAALQELLVSPDGKTVTWKLGGSFPHPYQALFEHSSDGVTWTSLGGGVAVPGVGYRLSGLSLPLWTNHYLRATGWTSGGFNNGSVSLHRSVLRFYAGPVPKFTLIYTAGPHGSIGGVTPQVVDYAASGSQVTAVPDAGYQFTGWSDGSTANPRLDANVLANISVTANFARSAALSPSKPSLSFLEGSGRAVDVEKGGAPTTQTLTLTNTGELPLTFTGGATGTPGLALTGRCAADYAIQSAAPPTSAPLAPGAAVTVVIRFAPRVATRTLGLDAALTVTSNSPLTPTLAIPLLGDAVPVSLSSFGVH